MGIGQGKPRGKRHAERIRVRGARHTGNDRKREEGTIYRAPTGERLKRHRKRKDKKGTMYRAPTGGEFRVWRRRLTGRLRLEPCGRRRNRPRRAGRSFRRTS